jgi:hypothetical protein
MACCVSTQTAVQGWDGLSRLINATHMQSVLSYVCELWSVHPTYDWPYMDIFSACRRLDASCGIHHAAPCSVLCEVLGLCSFEAQCLLHAVRVCCNFGHAMTFGCMSCGTIGKTAPPTMSITTVLVCLRTITCLDCLCIGGSLHFSCSIQTTTAFLHPVLFCTSYPSIWLSSLRWWTLMHA